MFRRQRQSTLARYFNLTNQATAAVEELRQFRDSVVASEPDGGIRDHLRIRSVEDAAWVERAQRELAEWKLRLQAG